MIHIPKTSRQCSLAEAASDVTTSQAFVLYSQPRPTARNRRELATTAMPSLTLLRNPSNDFAVSKTAQYGPSTSSTDSSASSNQSNNDQVLGEVPVSDVRHSLCLGNMGMEMINHLMDRVFIAGGTSIPTTQASPSHTSTTSKDMPCPCTCCHRISVTARPTL